MVMLNEWIRYGYSTISIVLVVIGCLLILAGGFSVLRVELAVVLAAFICSANHIGTRVEKYFRVLLDEKYPYSQLAQDYDVLWIENIVKEK